MNSEEIRDYMDDNLCSHSEAHDGLQRREFAEELRSDKSVGDLADTLIRILNFEFSGYEG